MPSVQQQSSATVHNSFHDVSKMDSSMGIICVEQGSNLIYMPFRARYENHDSSLPGNIFFDHQLWATPISSGSTKKQTDECNYLSLKVEAERRMSQLYLLNKDDDDAKSLSYLFDVIEQSFADHDLLFVDALLSTFDPKKCKPIISTGLLRSTFRAKSNLNAWRSCASRIISYLNQKGENTQHLLRGMIRANDGITLSTTSIS